MFIRRLIAIIASLLPSAALSQSQAQVILNTYDQTQPSANHSVVGYQITASQDYGSFGDLETHTGFNVSGGKSVSATDTTGSWQLFSARYTNYAGGTSESFITAGLALVEPMKSGHNNRGQWTAWNAVCRVDEDLTPDACVAEEDDILTKVAPLNVREGVRIVDVGSLANTYGQITDSALGIGKGPSAAGFKNGILFGDSNQESTFPITTGGSLISTAPSSVVLTSLIDFSRITAAPSSGAILLPPNALELCFGVSCRGGSVSSTTTTNGGSLVFANNLVSVNFSVPVFNVDASGNANVLASLHAAKLNSTPATPASSGAPCTAGDQVADANFIYVCVGTNSWKRASLSNF